LRAPELSGKWAACAGAFALLACAGNALERASASYQRDRDCPSLQRIAKELPVGTSRERVVALLGASDYEPTPGQHYYSSSRPDCSLVVDYRRGTDSTTSVQHTELGNIAE
jgi:hypothetical protein